MHDRCKHIDVGFDFLRNLTNEGIIELKYYNTHDQLIDILTKPLKPGSFVKFREGLGMKELYCITRFLVIEVKVRESL